MGADFRGLYGLGEKFRVRDIVRKDRLDEIDIIKISELIAKFNI